MSKKLLVSPGAVVLAALFFLLPAGLGAPAPPAFTKPPTVSANPNPGVPLAAVVRFSAVKPVRTTIKVSDGKHDWELNYDESRKPENGLPVLGMRPGRKHRIGVSIRDSAGNTAASPEPLEFTTPPLPSDPAEFPPIHIGASRPARMEPGVTLMSVRRQPGRGAAAAGRQFGEGYGLLLGLDASGEVVWYYRSEARISEFEHLRNGNLLFLTLDFRAIEIDMLGNVVAQWYAARRPQGPAEGIPVDTLTFHHSIRELPSGNLLVLGTELREIDNYYTSETDPNAPRKRQKVMGDEVVEFGRDGKLVWRWSAFDHLDPFRIGYLTVNNYWVIRGFPETLDWTHGNGLFYDARDDSVLLNLRQQSAVLKLARPGGQIRWIFGETGGWSEPLARLLFQPKGALEWPWHQHAASLTPAGTLLLFDNGINKARPFDPPVPVSQTYGRAVEYAIDPAARTARQLWVSEGPGPDAVISFAMGDAGWLPKTRNILVCYGDARERTEGPPRSRARVREYARTTPPELVFEAVLAHQSTPQPVTWAIFGSERIPGF